MRTFLLTTSLFILALTSCAPKSISSFKQEKTPSFNRTYEGSPSVNLKTYLTVYTEEGQWHVLNIKKETGKIQDLLFHKKFFTKDEADKFVNDFLKTIHLHQKSESLTPPMFVTELKQTDIWPTKNQWSLEWEEKYAEWFTKEIDPDYFVKNNLSVDCADVAYALRWIFSRIHYLPAAAQLSATSDLFTNESVKDNWKNLPTHEEWQKDRRFLAALHFVLDNTFTHTLKLELYPIAVTKKALTRGVVKLRVSGETGHTLNVIKVENDGASVPIQMMWSSVPPTMALSSGAFFESEQPDGKENLAFSRFRWPVKVEGSWKLIEGKKMPYYSLEQYEPELMKNQSNFTVAVLMKLYPDFDIKKLFEGGIDLIKNSLKKRDELVNLGYEFCKNHDCAPGSAGWEEWSTPSRDKQIHDKIRDLQKFSYELANNYFDQTGKQEKAWEVWTKSWKDPVLRYKDQDITLKEMAYIWTVGGYDVDPRKTPSERWGLDPQSFISNITSKVYDLLDTRSNKIKNNVCQKNACEPGSPLWKAHNTYKEDGELQYLEFNLARYCQYMTPERCEEFERLKKEKEIKVNLEVLTLQELFDRSFWLNSDPRWDDFARWGGFEKKWVHEKHNAGLIIYRTEDFLVYKDRKTFAPHVVDLKLNKAVPLEPEFEFIDFDVKTSNMISKNKNHYRIVDIRTEKTIDFERETKSTQAARWLGNHLLILPLNDYTFELIQIESDTILSIGTFTSPNKIVTNTINNNLSTNPFSRGGSSFYRAPRWWVISEGDRSFSLLDIENPKSKRPSYTISKDLGKYPYYQYIGVETPSLISLTIAFRKCNEDGCPHEKNVSLAINKSSGASRLLSDNLNNLEFPFVGMKTKNGMGIFKIDENLSIIEKLMDYDDIIGFMNWHKNIFMTIDQHQLRDLFKINSNGTIYNFPQNNQIISDITSDEKVIVFNKDSTMKMTDFKGTDILSMDKIIPILKRDAESPTDMNLFYGMPVASTDSNYYGLYALGKHENRPIITGMGLYLANNQNANEYPVFLGLDFDDIVKLTSSTGYFRPIEAVAPSSFKWSEKGFLLFRNQNEALWFSSDMP